MRKSLLLWINFVRQQLRAWVKCPMKVDVSVVIPCVCVCVCVCTLRGVCLCVCLFKPAVYLRVCMCVWMFEWVYWLQAIKAIMSDIARSWQKPIALYRIQSKHIYSRRACNDILLYTSQLNTLFCVQSSIKLNTILLSINCTY